MTTASQVQREIDQLTQAVDDLAGPTVRLRGAAITVRYVDQPERQRKWGVFWNEYPATTTKRRRPKQRSKFFAARADADTFRARLLPLLKRKAQQDWLLRSGGAK